jgi:hypothetical protein
MTQRFDGFDLHAAGWQMTPRSARRRMMNRPDLRNALTLTDTRIQTYHKAQLRKSRLP